MLLQEGDDLFLTQNENFPSTIQRSQLNIYSHIKHIRADLVLLNAKDMKIASINFEMDIEKEKEQIVYKFWEKADDPVSTVVWRPNTKGGDS